MLHQAKKAKNGAELVQELHAMETKDTKQFLDHLSNFCETHLALCCDVSESEVP